MSENTSKRNSLNIGPSSGVRKIQQMRSRSNSNLKKETKNTAGERILPSPGTNSARFNEDDVEAEVKKSKPNRTYQFNCGGMNDKEGGILNGQKIDWKATFDLPLEELAYPSLQRFEFDAIENQQTQLKEYTVRPRLFYQDRDHQFKLGDDNKTSSEYFHETIPKWTVNVTENRESCSSLKRISNEKNLLSEIEKKGEYYLRKRLKQCTASTILDNCSVKGWPLKTKPNLTKSEKITEETYLSLLRHESDQSPSKSIVKGQRQLHNFSDSTDSSRNILSEISSQPVEEKSTMRQRKVLKEFIPGELSDTSEGLLYYRMRNEARISELKKQPHAILKDPSVSSFVDQKVQKKKELSTALTKKISTLVLNNGITDVNKNEKSELTKRPLESTLTLQTEPIRPRPLTLSPVQDEILRSSEVDSPSDYLPLSRIAQAMRSKNYNYQSNHTNTKVDPDADAVSVSIPPPTWSALYPQKNDPKDKPELVEQYRVAEDVLLLAQLDAGKIPEEFLQKASHSTHLHVTIDLSNYSIGDAHGLCLARSLKGLGSLGTLGLRDNRLSSLSICPIIENLSKNTIMYLDLSQNSLHGKASKTISDFFTEKNTLFYLDISNCQLIAKEISILFKTLLNNNQNILQDLNISSNRIDLSAVQSISTYIASSKICHLKTFDLSDNDVGCAGAGYLATALTSNKVLSHLSLNSCSVGDAGAQHIASSLQRQQVSTTTADLIAADNSIIEVIIIVDIVITTIRLGIVGRGANITLQTLNLCRNNINSSACFVFANVLSTHPSMCELDLSCNPLGEAGARSLLRKMIHGYNFQCVVLMRDCTYNEENNIFDFTYPELKSPYILDLCHQYSIAILSELTSLADEDLGQFQFESLMYKDDSLKSNYSLLNAVQGGGIVVKSGGSLKVEVGRVPYAPLEELAESEQQKIEMDEQRAVTPEGLDAVGTTLSYARTDDDRKNWLRLMCQDIVLTTVQAQEMISSLTDSKIIGPGGAVTPVTVGKGT